MGHAPLSELAALTAEVRTKLDRAYCAVVNSGSLSFAEACVATEERVEIHRMLAREYSEGLIDCEGLNRLSLPEAEFVSAFGFLLAEQRQTLDSLLEGFSPGCELWQWGDAAAGGYSGFAAEITAAVETDNDFFRRIKALSLEQVEAGAAELRRELGAVPRFGDMADYDEERHEHFAAVRHDLTCQAVRKVISNL